MEMRKTSWAVALLAVSACAPTRVGGGGAAPPVNTADLAIAPDAVADTLLTDIQSVAPSIIVDLRYATPDNFTGAPLPGYQGNHAFLRREAARALAGVQSDLRGLGLSLKVFDAYRPVRATLAMVDWTQRVNRRDLLTNGYIASRSRHNLGLAIDLTLVEGGSGRELEMGTPFDTFSADAHTANATGIAATNRQKLKAAMERRGFVNYDQEWWHFSYDVPDPVRFDRVIR
jgi:D-alanyl-D-alanine dipeptidase